jgi:hypothetical protein
MKERPDYHDADLTIKVYDLRREPVMRDARNALNFTFWPKTFDEVAPILKSDHPLKASWRQVVTYWEMVYGMARHGIVHADYWIETHGEGLFLLAKVAPYLARLREVGSPTTLRNTEWIATETAEGRRLFGIVRARVEKLTAAR